MNQCFRRGPKHLAFIVLIVSILVAGCTSGSDGDRDQSFPLPSQLSREEYQTFLYDFLGSYDYRGLGWHRDKKIRDTGPYINGTYFGTHPAVRVYYSPGVMKWLEGGRNGKIPDGEFIIKEMYQPPALRYEGLSEAELPLPTLWTVMVKDSSGAVDGWYWAFFDSNPAETDPPMPQQPDDHDFPFTYHDSGFGSYCVRCHASAESELTFITTDNIEGFPGEPLEYFVDDSWINDPNGPGPNPHPNERASQDAREAPLVGDFVNEDWLALYDQFPDLDRSKVQTIPPVTTDRVIADAHIGFVTSDQCEPCHSGDNSPFGPNMIFNDEFDLSPFGEWRWGMMGLAGRDPVFYAQVDTETTLHGNTPGGAFTSDEIENLCLHCHGVMGQRQYVEDNPDELFTIEKARAFEEADQNRKYGGLARDGVSCMACHRAKDDSHLPLEDVETGDFLVDPPGDGVVTVYGPFSDPTRFPMLESLKMDPTEGPHLTSSRMCASCHTVFLPVLDDQGQVIDKKYEQSTYLEWLNSGFRDGEVSAASCQFCHMAFNFEGVNLDELQWKIANIHDQDFPPTTSLAPLADITVERRERFRRHNLLGINSFVLEFFRHFPDILGVRTRSFMTSFENGLARAIKNANDGAQRASGAVEILSVTRAEHQIMTVLDVSNLAGHRLPSGVSFRRLFLEVVVLDANRDMVWGSGRTNNLGVIVDGSGNPLPSEFHEVDPATGEQRFEPHYQIVDSEDKAQIYAELIKDANGEFTTSFLARVDIVKDNRLLPFGWTPDGPPGFTEEFAEATSPHGLAASDPDFTDGDGTDRITYVSELPRGATGPFRVRATLYYQSIPPVYLNDRFNQASGPGTRRLHYLGAHLDDSQTTFANWKQPVSSDEEAAP